MLNEHTQTHRHIFSAACAPPLAPFGLAFFVDIASCWLAEWLVAPLLGAQLLSTLIFWFLEREDSSGGWDSFGNACGSERRKPDDLSGNLQAQGLNHATESEEPRLEKTRGQPYTQKGVPKCLQTLGPARSSQSF